MNTKDSRIEWIDVFKGLAIILVVLGHSTDLFNLYVYQFHVAALFFISGMVAKFDNSNFIYDIYKKFMTLIMPLLTAVVLFAILLSLMNMTGIYHFFWNPNEYMGIKTTIVYFLTTGGCIDLFVPGWFLIVLFGSNILSRILYFLSRRKLIIFAVLSVLLYVVGYYVFKKSLTIRYYADIALVAQLYYSIGFICKKITSNVTVSRSRKSLFISLGLFSLSCAVMFLIFHFFGINSLMDIAGRTIRNPIISLIAATNGIFWLYLLSKIIVTTNISLIKNAIIKIGQNTLGIVLFHFSMFRIVALLLVALKKADVSELLHLVPSGEIGRTFWIIYVIAGVGGSYLIWNIIKKIPILKHAFAADRSHIEPIWVKIASEPRK